MAATQSSDLASQTGLYGPQSACTEPTLKNESATVSHDLVSDGLNPLPARKDVGMPTPTTPSVAKPIHPRQAESPTPRNKEAAENEEGSIIDCEGDDEHSTGRGSLLFDSLGGPYNDRGNALDERRKVANKRLMQSKAYTQLLEDRVTVLEKTVQRIQKLPPLPTTRDDSDDEDKVPVTSPRVDILSWAEFRAKSKVDKKPGSGWTHRPEIETRDRNNPEQMKGSIEILGEEPRFSWEFKLGGRFHGDDLQIPTMTDLPVLPGTEGQLLAEVEPHRIRIRSKLLLQVLDNITGCYASAGPYGHRLVLLRPFKLLVTFEKQLTDYLAELDKIHSNAHDANGNDESAPVAGPVTETKSVEARDHLKILSQVINVNLQSQLKLHRLGPQVQKVRFHDLWYVFKPGFEVRTRDEGQIQLYRVIQVTGGRDTLSIGKFPDISVTDKLKEEGYSAGAFVIECFYIHFDGSRYGPVNATFQIRKFEGEKNVTSFPIYPIQWDPESQETRRHLLDRGKKFAKLSNIKNKASAHRKYKGLTLDINQEQVDSEIIIDFQLAFLRMKDDKPILGTDGLVGDDMREVDDAWRSCTACERSGCCGNDVIFMDYEVDNKQRRDFKDEKKELFEFIDDEEHLTPEHRILLPPKVHGFVLRTRKWATFDISLITHPDYKSGWKQLVIDDDTKKTVQALVNNHERPGPDGDSSARRSDHVLSSVDLVQGKGRGLIILLHGAPGVGKTSTAECVAAHSKRPLFPITCGDIGDKAQEVEANLEQNFQLAHKWGCVLLLDEADIFLSTRNEEDIQRNAIVSVFLRTLEYYSGILFLTTNRVGTIDRAFKSRIHLSLYYPRFDKDSTVEIWKNNLERVKEEFRNENKEINLDDYDNIVKFAKTHFKDLKKTPGLGVWNGRQIRNAFQTAIAIATYEAKETSSGNAIIPRLSVGHFKKVAKSARQFDIYLNSVNSNKSEADLAKQRIERQDEFKSNEVVDDDDAYWSATARRRRKGSGRNRKESSSVNSGSNDDSSSAESSGNESAPKSKKRKKH